MALENTPSGTRKFRPEYNGHKNKPRIHLTNPRLTVIKVNPIIKAIYHNVKEYMHFVPLESGATGAYTKTSIQTDKAIMEEEPGAKRRGEKLCGKQCDKMPHTVGANIL